MRPRSSVPAGRFPVRWLAGALAFAAVAVTAAGAAGAAAGASSALPGNAAETATASHAGSGAPPASFWGNTGKIPAAKNVLEVEILNRTGGRYPDSKVFWSFDGTEKSIAQQPYIDMPANSAGRL